MCSCVRHSGCLCVCACVTVGVCVFGVRASQWVSVCSCVHHSGCLCVRRACITVGVYSLKTQNGTDYNSCCWINGTPTSEERTSNQTLTQVCFFRIPRSVDCNDFEHNARDIEMHTTRRRLEKIVYSIVSVSPWQSPASP